MPTASPIRSMMLGVPRRTWPPRGVSAGIPEPVAVGGRPLVVTHRTAAIATAAVTSGIVRSRSRTPNASPSTTAAKIAAQMVASTAALLTSRGTSRRRSQIPVTRSPPPINTNATSPQAHWSNDRRTSMALTVVSETRAPGILSCGGSNRDSRGGPSRPTSTQPPSTTKYPNDVTSGDSLQSGRIRQMRPESDAGQVWLGRAAPVETRVPLNDVWSG
jgi:hypothetical protein